MYALGLRSRPGLNIITTSSFSVCISVPTLISAAWRSPRDVACHGSGRPDRRGRRDLPYIRKMSRDKQKDYERREAGILDDDEEGLVEGDEFNESEELRLSSAGLGKLPIESNGPPLLILHPYISEEKPVDERALRPLPLPSPHKLRPLNLPRPNLRRRFGSVPLKKPAIHVVDFVKDLAADIQSLPDESEVSEVLDKYVWKMKRGALSKTLKDLGRMELTERILQVFLWLQKQPHLWPDDITLSAMIRALVESGEIEIAVKLHRGVGSDSPKAAQALASALAKAGMLEEAIEVTNHMIQSGWKVDGSVHTTVTQWACRTGLRDVAITFWDSVELSDLRLKLQNYTAIISSCSKLGLFDVVERVYQDFIDSGNQPNIVVYTTLISVLSRQGKYREAAALFWEMEEAGCEPDLMAYEVMLDVCAQLEDLNKGLKVYKDLKNAGFSPTPGFYNTLIQLILKKGSLSRAKDITREMSIRGYTPSAKTLSCLSASVTAD